eukprot:1766169-Prymnesium_polylepis.1
MPPRVSRVCVRWRMVAPGGGVGRYAALRCLCLSRVRSSACPFGRFVCLFVLPPPLARWLSTNSTGRRSAPHPGHSAHACVTG